MFCTKCHVEKDLLKNRTICKDCKNDYERERRRKEKENQEVKKEKKEIERIRYQTKKLSVKEVILDANKNKICSVCNIEKSEMDFHVAKNKGHIRAMCKDCSSIKRKEYYKNNREAIIKQTNNYTVQKMNAEPIFKMERRLRTRIYQAFKAQTYKKNNRTWKYLNCTASEFQKWIEYQLYDGMTMENYGKFWNLDHVKACSNFDLSNENEVKECFCWKNIRPYRSEKNREKYNKVILHDILMQELKVKCYLKHQEKIKYGLKSHQP
jgi:hypothetical protein